MIHFITRWASCPSCKICKLLLLTLYEASQPFCYWGCTCYRVLLEQSQKYVEGSEPWAALACVDAVVGPLALPCFGKDRSQSGGKRSASWSNWNVLKEWRLSTAAVIWAFHLSFFGTLSSLLLSASPGASFQPISIQHMWSVISKY